MFKTLVVEVRRTKKITASKMMVMIDDEEVAQIRKDLKMKEGVDEKVIGLIRIVIEDDSKKKKGLDNRRLFSKKT